MTVWEAFALTLNVVVGAVMYLQHRRFAEYREQVHALVDDEGFVEGEAAAFIDETLRVTAHMELPEPTPRDFAHSLLNQRSFRRAVVHEELHRIYLETQGRKA